MDVDFRLQDWIIRPRLDQIERGDEVVHIHHKPMAVLVYLADRAGEIVTRCELFDAVWPGLIVSDDALTQCIVDLRKVFGDSAHHSHIIMTVPKVGFRLIASVEFLIEKTKTPLGVYQQVLPGAAKSGKLKKLTIWAPVGVFVLVIALLASWIPRLFFARELDTYKSIAVIPFKDISKNGDQGYFTNGLSEELIYNLSQLDGLKVIGRASSFAYEGKQEDLRVIAGTLGATHLLTGAVRGHGKQLRITAQLVDGSSGFQLWVENFDLELINTLAVQEEVSMAITVAMERYLELKQKHRHKSALAATTNIDAQHAFMRGRHLVARNTRVAIEGAIREYKKAIEIDQDFAIAHAELAVALRLLWLNGGDLTKIEALEQAAFHAQKALRLDPDISEAYTTLAWMQDDLGKKVEYYEKAIQLNPNYSMGYDWLATALESAGRYQEANAIRKRAFQLDPLAISVINNYILSLARRNLLVEAKRHVDKLAYLSPENHAMITGYLAGLDGRWSAWVEGSLNGLLINPEFAPNRMMLAKEFAILGLEKEALAVHGGNAAEILELLGRSEEAVAYYQSQLAESPGDMGTLRNLGRTLAAMGEYQRARPFLEKAWERGGGLVTETELFTAYDAAALIAIRRAAGEKNTVDELLAALNANVRRLRDAGMTASMPLHSVDFQEGLAAFLAGERETGLSLIGKAVGNGFWFRPHDAYLQTLYDAPGFEAILEVQKTRQMGEQIHFLDLVCTRNPYQAVWQPFEGTCNQTPAEKRASPSLPMSLFD